MPFKALATQYKSGQIYFNGQYFKVWDSYGLHQYTFLAGSFSEDARGRWYFNAAVEVSRQPSTVRSEIGIDLGLNTTAICSDGSSLAKGRFYRGLESALGIAQRAGKKAPVSTIHAKIANRRKDALHKFTSELATRGGLIVVGNVSPRAIAKTNKAKSVMDAGWGQLKTMLEYKCDRGVYEFLCNRLMSDTVAPNRRHDEQETTSHHRRAAGSALGQLSKT